MLLGLSPLAYLIIFCSLCSDYQVPRGILIQFRWCSIRFLYLYRHLLLQVRAFQFCFAENISVFLIWFSSPCWIPIILSCSCGLFTVSQISWVFCDRIFFFLDFTFFFTEVLIYFSKSLVPLISYILLVRFVSQIPIYVLIVFISRYSSVWFSLMVLLQLLYLTMFY